MAARKQYVNGKKHCSRCDLWKEPEAFPVDRRRWDGKHPYCRACTKDSYRKEAHAKRTAQYEKNIGERYGLTVAEYKALVNKPCSICGTTDVRRVVDHCHSRGQIRDALCDKCNVALGAMDDDPARLRAAAAYLELHA